MPSESLFPDAASLAGLLERQKEAQRVEGIPDAGRRIDRIDRAIDLLVRESVRIEAAIRQDFGHRSRHTTLFADIGASVASLKHARANLRGWMKPQRRRTTPAVLGWLGARAEVRHQPKGVVGIVAPWNYPVHLVFSPLAGAFAAGCRAMVKPSERTPRTSELLAELVRSSFDEAELAVVLGGADTGAAFASLPFDHLLFTGSAETGRKVAAAAAGNLVPVTLELGGKSPAVVGRDADLEAAVLRILAGKLSNAGQICLAPDYALVPRELVDAFVEIARKSVAAMFPDLPANPDYTALIDDRHRDRIRALVDDAASHGARIVELAPSGGESAPPTRKFPPLLVLDPTDGMAVLREEIFGPVLPVVPYGSFEEAVAFVEARPRPLGLYWFGRSPAERRRILSIPCGGSTLGDVVQHVAMEDLPFGGIGPSGMGNYHGVHGFRTFSHPKAVLHQSRLDLGAVLRPPYGRGFDRILSGMLRR